MVSWCHKLWTRRAVWIGRRLTSRRGGGGGGERGVRGLLTGRGLPLLPGHVSLAPRKANRDM